MIRGSRQLGVLAMTAAAALLLAGCSDATRGASSIASPSATDNTSAAGSPQEAAQQQKLYAEAKKEGPVTFYCNWDVNTCNKMVSDYEAAFPGVKATADQMVSATISSRYAAEKAANAPTADVLTTSDYAFLQGMLAQGFTTPLNKAGIPGMADWPAQWWSNAVGSPIGAKGYPIGYNTNLVKGSDIPKTINDLLKPKWKGKIDGPAGGSVGTLAGYAVFVQDTKDFGNAMVHIVKKQQLKYVNGGDAPAISLMAAGEVSLMFPSSSNNILAEAQSGAPVSYVFPKVTAGNPIAWAINSRPTHPAGAKLFISFVTSQKEDIAVFPKTFGIEDRWLKPTGFTVIPPNPSFFSSVSEQQKIAKLLGQPLE